MVAGVLAGLVLGELGRGLRVTDNEQGELLGDQEPLPVPIALVGQVLRGHLDGIPGALGDLEDAAQECQRVGGAPVVQGEEQMLLITEIRVKGATGQADPFADVPDRRAMKPPLGEDFQRAVEEVGHGGRPALGG
jgi:hypothetical protein